MEIAARELTAREVNILLALAASEMSGYKIVRQCEEDTSGDLVLSNGTIFPALRKLLATGAIAETAQQMKTMRPQRVYRITMLGRQLLEWKLAMYRRMVRLGQERI
jgi:DNA-binding PadR family transcriptional regulator